MSIKVSNHPVPENRMQQFHEILCATGGRYIGNPRRSYRSDDQPGAWFRVDFEYDDMTGYNELNRRWDRCTAEITEFNKNEWWRVWLRRIVGIIR